MSLLTPEQGSLVLAVLQAAFAVLLWPTVRNQRAEVPRSTSVPTAIGIWLMALTFWAMGPLWWATATSAVCGLGWTLIAVLRPVRPQDTGILKIPRERLENIRNHNLSLGDGMSLGVELRLKQLLEEHP